MDALLEKSPPREARANLRIFDADVHPVLESGIQSLYDYMPEAWRERFIRKRAFVSAYSLPLRFQHPNGAIDRDDAKTPSGKPAASDPKYLVEDLLERNGIGGALLNNLQVAGICAVLGSLDETVVLAAASNDFFIENWLPVDRRLKFAMAIPSQNPTAAAAEIRRVGRHPQVAAVALPLVNILMGHPYYWPIYEAAQELNLPVVVHATGTDSIFQGTPITTGGLPDTYLERYVTLVQMGESSVTSLVCSGVFERYPGLKVVFAELGVLWLVPLLWRLDRSWRQLRHETPWVKRSPIDYVHERIRFTTQPIDEPRDHGDLEKMLSLLGYDVLVFSTDYPHWDNELPDQIISRIPVAERENVFFNNAANVFRMS
jgi:predicted TIM-barrel fold metal-dependent hydrolase